MTTGQRVDPRFRRISKKATKVVVDRRFQGMFEDDQFVAPVKVDKYGRHLEADREKRELGRFYRLDEEEEDEDSDNETGGKTKVQAAVRADSEAESGSGSGSFQSQPSSSDSDDSDNSASEDNVMDEALSAHPLVIRDVPMGEATRRLALVNMDWDQITADDIYTLVYGFKPTAGSIEAVTIYPSRFGRERMARESLEGPPRELFDGQPQEDGDEDDDGGNPPPLADGGDEDGVNSKALRRYQLERLRYYYAVIECDSVETARHIYQRCDGSEFEKSANFLDLRFIPDSVSFSPEEDGPLRDVATELPKNYRAKPDLCTAALQSTRVALTWDADDAERVRVTRRAPLRGDEQEEADLRAYLASASSEEEVEQESQHGDGSTVDRYRNLLKEPAASVFGRKGETKDLSITFTSALRADSNEDKVDQEATFFEQEDEDRSGNASRLSDPATDRTPFGKYLERRKAKRQARKEAAKAAKETATQERRQQRKGKSAEELQAEEAERQRLSLLLSDADNDKDDEDVTRRQAKRAAEDIDLEDVRFAAIYDEPEYALDPSHPAFKRNRSTEKIIKERQRRRQQAERG